MQEKKDSFFSLIKKIIKLEEEYEKVLDQYNHLQYLYYHFGKENKNARTTALYECNVKKTEIEDLIKLIPQYELDSAMEEYYELYEERSKIFKELWHNKTEMGYRNSTLIFDCWDEKGDKKISKEVRKLRKKNKELQRQIDYLNLSMSVIDRNR